jgi:2'-5' RNA ligase
MTRGATARLFVALDLPPDVRAQLAAWARSGAASMRAASRAAAGAPAPSGSTDRAPRSATRRAAARGRLRLLEPNTLHLTLCFLGDRPVREIGAIGEALAIACAEAPPVGALTLGAPLWLPPRRPRALAVELHDDPHRALGDLHYAVSDALALVCDRSKIGLQPERRRFRPHVTLARLRSGDAPLERALPATPPLSFLPRSVTLQRSWLTPTEAVYEGLATHPLASRD